MDTRALALAITGLLWLTTACMTDYERGVPVVQAPEVAPLTEAEWHSERDAFRASAVRTLDELGMRVAALKERTPEDATAREAHRASVTSLENQLRVARRELADLDSVTPSDWADRLDQIDRKLLTVRAGYQAANTRFAH